MFRIIFWDSSHEIIVMIFVGGRKLTQQFYVFLEKDILQNPELFCYL